ncbi:MAG: MFS transporter [Actinobacteria bacterium]|nr:MAG: MFS transporter [Actinomycetota bacterium]
MPPSSRSSEPTPTDEMNEGPAGPSGPVASTRSGNPQRSTRDQVRRLFTASGFRRFFATRMISQLGDGVFQLSAGAVLLFDHPGKNPALALLGVFAVALVPYSALGPFVGVFIDRWERRKILTWVPVGRALCAATIPAAVLLGKRGWAFYLVVLVVLSSNRFFLATMSAVLPQLVEEDDLLVANTVATTGGSIANVVGQGLGAGISAVTGGTFASAVSSVAFAGSAVTARAVPVHRGFTPERGPLLRELKDVVAEMVDGARIVARNARVVYALAAITMIQLLVGAMSGVLVYFFIHVLQLKVGSAAFVLGVLAAGIGAGVVLVPFIARRMRHDRLVPLAFAVGGLGNLIAAPHFSKLNALIGTVLVGISYALAKIPVDTIVQEEMADMVRGRAFSLYDMIFNLARVVGIGVIGFAYEEHADSGMLVWGIAGVFFLAAFSFGMWERSREMGLKGWWARRKNRGPKPEDMLQPGEIVTVRAYAGSRADEEPRAIVVGGHEVPIQAIDWRAIVEESGRRARVFVVRAAGRRVRLSQHEDDTGWQIERVGPLPQGPAD